MQSRLHKALGFLPALLLSWASLPVSLSQEVLVREVVSREVGIHVGGVSDPDIKEVVSREVSFYVEYGRNNQVISREYSLVKVDSATPPIITDANISFTPAGDSVTLDWSSYNQWAVRDVDHYAIYYSTAPFSGVSGMTPTNIVRGETQQFTLTGLSKP